MGGEDEHSGRICKAQNKTGGPQAADCISNLREPLARRAGVLEDRAEQLPALAVELHHLKLLVDAIVGR